MRLVYFGSGAFGLPTLRRLVRAHDVTLVVTQPDRPAGRHRKPTPTPVAELAANESHPILKAEDVNSSDALRQIQDQHAEAFVVIAFGQKLSDRLVGNVLAINLHASLLPRYRGAAPINWAIINGERETGLSVITLAQRMDAGDVLGQMHTAINPMETAGELHDRMAGMGPEIVMRVLDDWSRGELQPRSQDEHLATRAPKLAKADGTVRFDQPAESVQRWVHGLTPWPGCTVRLDGRTLRLARVCVAGDHQSNDEPGVVLDNLTIACSLGSIGLLEVQPPGGRLMTFHEYCNGQPVRPGARCEPL
jgi:methionyl-tRNA formyltransferase